MLNKHDKRHKEYLKLERRLNQLYELSYKEPFVKLEEPYQSGWTIYYDLREDIKRREDYAQIAQAIELGYDKKYTRDATHVKNVRRNFPVKEPIYPGRKMLKWKQIPETLKNFFTSVYDSRYPNMYHIHVREYWLVRKVKPYMVTHKRSQRYEGEMEKIRKEMQLDKYAPFYYNRNYTAQFPAGKVRTATRNEIRHFMNGDIDDLEHKKIHLEYDD